MNSNTIFDSAKIQFDLSFDMLEKMIDQCPEDLWNEKKGGFVFWQQLLHAFCGINFWMRNNNDAFEEPFKEKNVYPELENDPEINLSREEIRQYKDKVKGICKAFFENGNDNWLNSSSLVYDKLRNIDIILMQIRHIQYHVGHCNSILRENKREAVDWVDYFPEE